MNYLNIRQRLTAAALAAALAAGAFAQGIDGDWKGTLALGAGRELPLVFHVSKAENTVSMDSPAQGAFGLACIVNLIEADSLSISIPNLMVKYTARLSGGILDGTFKQGGVQLPLRLERGSLDKPKRPQTPTPPFPYSTEEVTIASDVPNVSLAGTLTLPPGANPSTPAVVMVTGSGQQNRDEEIFDHKPFAVIADYLARNGIASLRYDDRGFAASTGDVSSATTADFAHDAQSVIDWLRTNRKFAKVGVLGHSEGGMIAYKLCNNSSKAPDFIISVAGPAVPGEQILEYQNIEAMSKMGIGEQQAKTIFRSKLDQLASQPWMAYFLRYDPTEDLKAVNCPALLIFGEKDKQVPPSINLEPARKYAPTAEIVCYPQLNHLMQHATTGDVREYSLIEETFASEVLQRIAEFINKLN